jgi:hypothetical protein
MENLELFQILEAGIAFLTKGQGRRYSGAGGTSFVDLLVTTTEMKD